jgi:hypothetical protein
VNWSGESINIWTDNWVQGLPSLKPLLRPADAQAEMVCDLFLLGMHQWNEHAIRNMLCAFEAEEILKLRRRILMLGPTRRTVCSPFGLAIGC